MDEVLDDDFGVAEPEHLETMFDALIDTVSGNESLSLSNAQTYAMSVLGASGMASRADMVTGVEGFFSEIGAGVGKVWEYIKKMFQGIWNWFFGKKEKGPSITEQTDAILKANQASLKAWAQADAHNSAEVSKQFGALSEALEEFRKNGSAAEQKQAEEAKEALQATKLLPAPQQARAIKVAAEVVVKLNSRTQKAIDQLCEQGINSNKQYLALVHEDHSASFAGTQYESNYAQFRTWSKDYEKQSFEPYVRLPKGMSKLEHAEQAQRDLAKVMVDIKHEIGSISTSFKTDVIAKIKQIESVLGKNLKDVNRDKFSKDLTACKIFLGLTTRHIKQLEKTQEIIKRLSNMIVRLFGLRP